MMCDSLFFLLVNGAEDLPACTTFFKEFDLNMPGRHSAVVSVRFSLEVSQFKFDGHFITRCFITTKN